MIKHIILVCLGFISTSMAAANKTDVDFEELNRVIAKAQNNSWAEMKDNGWNFPTYLGSWFLSEYYFELKALGLLEQSQFNQTFFTQLLLDTQLPDGSWEQVHEHNLKTGGLDPTIFNYLYLKTVGVDHNSEMMVKAKNWVLAHGGIEGAQTMSKMKLAAFGHYSWTGFLDIPLMIFRKEGLFSYAYVKDVVAQWVYPHLTALTYMRHFQVVYELGEEITELWLRPPREIRIHEVKIFGSPSWDVENLVNEILLLR